MKKILILLISISLQNCKSDAEKVQENAINFTENLLHQNQLSKSFIQTFGIQSQNQLANLKAEKPIPCIYIQKEDLKDFETFKNIIEGFKSDTYLVNYSLNGKLVSQWTFISSSVVPITGTGYDCGVLNPEHPNVVDSTTGFVIPVGVQIIGYISLGDDSEYEIFKHEGELYGRPTNSKSYQSTPAVYDLMVIYKQILSKEY